MRRRQFLIKSISGEGGYYFTIEALEDGLTAKLSNNACEYRIDNGNWNTLSTDTNTPSVNTGQKISFKITNPTISTSSGIGTFTISKKCNVEGNIMSLLYGDNFERKIDLSEKKTYTFYNLFKNCTTLQSAENLILPATTLKDYCYSYMFYGCSSLTVAPELPATILTYASSCYSYMFRGCSSLTTAPELPATTVAMSCYSHMFEDCTSLTTVPEVLPATTLTDASGCYSSMFKGCTSLMTAPELPATTVESNCYDSMFYDCTSLTTVPEVLPATTLTDASGCYSYMFYGCTSLTTAPELPATILAGSCYREMFYGCSSLTTVPEVLPATTLANTCYCMMFQYCTSLVTAPELPATTLVSNCYPSMFEGCSKLNYIKMLATDISAPYCLSGWVSGVARSGTFIKNVDMTTLLSGTSGIPSGWTVKDNVTLLDCISLEIIADDVNGRDTNTTIYYTAQVNALDEDGNQLVITKTGSAISEEFPQNTSETESIDRIITFTYMGVTATTTITQGVWVNQSYTIMLNDQWQLSDKPNPDASLYDGVYESFSNKGVNSKAAIMYIDIVGYTDFNLYIRSYAESNYDYVMVSQLDQSINNDTSYSNTTLVKAHTRGKQTSGTDISNYTHVQFTSIDGGEHRITIVYRKDVSSASGDDKGYVLIEKGFEDVLPYFTIEALEDGLTAKLSNNACEYRIDNGSWNTLSANTNTESINKGQTLSFKGNLTPNSSNGIGTFTISKSCNIEGNIMSLLYGDDFVGKTDLTGKNYAFYNLFKNCTTLQSAENLILPATTLANYCYRYMFYGCTSLTTAPELPATTLRDSCYQYMFYGCTSLVTAPELPATILADYCYYYMFKGCTSLITAPELPATALSTYCYHSMFYGCSSLTVAPELPATTLINSCYNSMFYGCTSLTTAPELPATTLKDNCYYSMFEGCTSLTTVPELLPATTLANNCYREMFYGCTSLTTAPELPATTLATYCYNSMFKGCSKLNYIKMLATDISAESCLTSWVYRVASNGTFIKHPNMTSLPSGSSGIPSGWTVEDVDYTGSYFTIEALEDGLTAKLSVNACEYSLDGNTWNSLSADTNTPTVNTGEKISFKGNLTPTSNKGIGTFTISKKCNLEGNIMSLLYGDDSVGKTDLTGKNYAFYNLFKNCTTLQSAENLILPATTLANYCYGYMFSGCTKLETAPELPATTLATYCYYNMFDGCSSLTVAPELPATTLANYCYAYMFDGCSSLTVAPELPVTTLANWCYAYMFRDCTLLTTAPELPVTTLATYCYYYMFDGCSSLTVAPELPATTLANYCYGYMFSGCTGLTTAPELPVTTLASNCYAYMFDGCSNLTVAPELPATILATYCYEYMFRGCTNLTEAPELPATTLAQSCYRSMFYNCSSLTVAPELPVTTLANWCYAYMFYGCTLLTTAPELPATTLATYCYYGMFAGCSKLNYIKMLATDISASGCLDNWVNSVARSGTFIKHPDMTTLLSGTSGIPSGWTVEDNVESITFTIDGTEYQAEEGMT